MSEKQDTDVPTCVLKMSDEFRSEALVPTGLRFDDSTSLTDNKEKIFTDNHSVSTTEVRLDDSDVTVFGKFTDSVIQ